MMWVVGYLYNNNGMGTWCWEAAHALAEAGEPVTLVCSPTVTLPGPTTLPILRVAPRPLPESIPGKILLALGQLSAQGPRVMRDAVRILDDVGTPATIVLLNSTEFYDPDVLVPQLVTAWARGILLRQYIARMKFHLHGVSHHSLRVILGTLGWWRKDWRSFHRADVVLAVTTPLAQELRGHGVRVELMHPCTHASSVAPAVRPPGNPVRLLTAAVSLGEPRKRVLWMLDALRDWAGTNCTLTLVGTPNEQLLAAARALSIPVEFTGSLSRDDVVRTMLAHDLFLFASILDDWGYVVTEAMAQGLAVIAPAIAPFDEILGETGALYAPDDPAALRHALDQLTPHVATARHKSWLRARSTFSRSAFVGRLRSVVAEHSIVAVRSCATEAPL